MQKSKTGSRIDGIYPDTMVPMRRLSPGSSVRTIVRRKVTGFPTLMLNPHLLRRVRTIWMSLLWTLKKQSKQVPLLGSRL